MSSSVNHMNGADRPNSRPRPQFEPRPTPQQSAQPVSARAYASYDPIPLPPSIPPGAVPFGIDAALLQDKKLKEVVCWHPDSVTNHHLGIAGGSGTGKTYWLKKLIAQLPPDVEVNIFDWHGDIEIDGPDVTTCRFSTSTKYGYNPLI